jgi:RecA/RadA recombinase
MPMSEPEKKPVKKVKSTKVSGKVGRPKKAKPPEAENPLVIGDAKSESDILTGSESRQLVQSNVVLTKKGKEHIADSWSSENRKKSLDAMVQGMIEAGKRKFGVDQVFASKKDLEKLIIGLPVPALAYEYLLSRNTLPLRSIYQIAGKPESLKSTLLYEFYKWFQLAGGIVTHIETEGKFNTYMANAILNLDGGESMIVPNVARTHDEAQQMISYYLQQFKLISDGNKECPGPGKTIPFVIGLDSYNGATSEEVVEKVRKKGSAERGYAVNALKNSIYMPVLKSEMYDIPMLFLTVNHLSEKVDRHGNIEEVTLGGQSIKYHEIGEIRLRAEPRAENAKFGYRKVSMTTGKSSFAPPKRRITARFLDWAEPREVDGRKVWEQKFAWDWNWAICDLLYTLSKSDKYPTDRQRLKDAGLKVVATNPQGALECRIHIPLFMKSGESMPYVEAGQIMHDEPSYAQAFRDALLIKTSPKLETVYDMVEKYKKEAK